MGVRFRLSNRLLIGSIPWPVQTPSPAPPSRTSCPASTPSTCTSASIASASSTGHPRPLTLSALLPARLWSPKTAHRLSPEQGRLGARNPQRPVPHPCPPSPQAQRRRGLGTETVHSCHLRPSRLLQGTRHRQRRRH